jgi:hypothetical protein
MTLEEGFLERGFTVLPLKPYNLVLSDVRVGRTDDAYGLSGLVLSCTIRCA